MKLGSNDIHLYFVRPGLITDSKLLLQYQSLLSAEEQQQMTRFYYERHRHQFLVTRALIRTSLSNYFDVLPANWVFSKNAYDKPEIAHPDSGEQIRFNISHADGLIMCGMMCYILEYIIICCSVCSCGLMLNICHCKHATTRQVYFCCSWRRLGQISWAKCSHYQVGQSGKLIFGEKIFQAR